MRVRPSDSAISVKLGVVAIPSGSTVERLRVVVVAVTMSAHVEKLVLGSLWGGMVQLGDSALETLPLSQIVVGTVGIGRIRLVYKTKIGRGEIKGSSVGCGFILQEVSCDCGVVEVRAGAISDTGGKRAAGYSSPKRKRILGEHCEDATLSLELLKCSNQVFEISSCKGRLTKSL